MPSKKLSSRTNAYLSALTLIVILTAVGVVSEIFYHKRLDLTRDKEFTLSSAAVKTLNNLPDMVTIKVVMSKDLPTQFLQIRTYVIDLLDEFQARSHGKLNLVFEDPGDDAKKRQEVTSLGIQEVQLQEQSSEGMQIKKGFFGLAMTYGDKKEVIPVLENLQTFEYDLIVKLKKLTGAVKTVGVIEGSGGEKFSFTLPGSPPKTTTGFDENYTTLKQEMDKLYKVKNIDVSHGPVPDDVDLVLVAAPNHLNEYEKFYLDQFIMKGKAAIFFTPGVTVNLSSGINGTATDNGYEDLLSHYGLGVEKNVILEARNWELVRFGNSFFPTPYPYWIVVGYNTLDADNPITSKLQSLSFPWTSSLDIDTTSKDSLTHTVVLARTSDQAWEEKNSFYLLPRDLKEYLPIKQHAFPLIALKTGKFTSFYASHPIPKSDSTVKIDSSKLVRSSQGQSAVMVIPNALFATDFYVGYTNATGNLNLVLNAMDQLVLDPDLINVRSRNLETTPIAKAKIDADRMPITLINMILAPALLLAMGVFIGMRRRRMEAKA